MNWNRNMSREEWKKRRAYPSKRTMNLYYREDRTARPATVLLYVLFLLVVLGALGKVLIFDPLQEIDRDVALRVLEESGSYIRENSAVLATGKISWSRLARRPSKKTSLTRSVGARGTSASSRARRTSRMPSRTSASVRRPLPRRRLNVAFNFSESPSNAIGVTPSAPGRCA